MKNPKNIYSELVKASNRVEKVLSVEPSRLQNSPERYQFVHHEWMRQLYFPAMDKYNKKMHELHENVAKTMDYGKFSYLVQDALGIGNKANKNKAETRLNELMNKAKPKSAKLKQPKMTNTKLTRMSRGM